MAKNANIFTLQFSVHTFDTWVRNIKDHGMAKMTPEEERLHHLTKVIG